MPKPVQPTPTDCGNLPAEYTPSSLRPPKSQPREADTFACGYEHARPLLHKPGSYGMFAGPFPDLIDALEIVPGKFVEAGSPRAVIIHYKKDGTDDIIYEWFQPRTGIPRWRRVDA